MYNTSLHFHFTGIGGSGMSGIAEVLLNLGFKVSGSDLKCGDVCKRLERFGASISEGHSAKNVPEDASLLVYSSAVGADNPELIEARERRIPVIRRAEVLAELVRLKYGIAVAGSHGKTTTTSMIAAILDEAGIDPTVIIGGIVNALGSGSRVGKSDFLVAETDESDKSFLLLTPTIAVVTNIDAEHLGAYGTLQELENSFDRFVAAVPFYGLGIFCIDDARCRGLAQRYERRHMTYGFAPDAEIRAVDVSLSREGARFKVLREGEHFLDCSLPVFGRHLVQNSLAAICVAIELGISAEVIASGLGRFSGVRRRLELIGTKRGISVFSDYGHHPTEIQATISAIREGWQGGGGEVGRLWVVFQPHRYSRTRDCFAQFLESFSECDELVITGVYAASEEPIEGVSGRSLCDAISHRSKRFVEEVEDVTGVLVSNLSEGDTVVFLGAGTIGSAGAQLLEAL